MGNSKDGNGLYSCFQSYQFIFSLPSLLLFKLTQELRDEVSRKNQKIWDLEDALRKKMTDAMCAKTDFIVIRDDLMTDTILCFDLGTKTSWVIYGVDGHIMSGTVNFQPAALKMVRCVIYALNNDFQKYG